MWLLVVFYKSQYPNEHKMNRDQSQKDQVFIKEIIFSFTASAKMIV